VAAPTSTSTSTSPAAAGRSSGEEQALGIVWQDIEVKIGNREILQLKHGVAHPGRLLGIVGPSGCGKTTLLNCLAQSVPKVCGQRLKGDVRLTNGKRLDLNSGDIAFMSQDDSFFSMLTVRETLEMAAELQLPSVAQPQRAGIVDNLLESLSLIHVQHNFVGGGRERGISGGERRRLSLARELLGNLKILIADEPTSGLDTFQAEHVVRILRKLAKHKRIVVAVTLHQPRSSVWHMLDEILVLTPNGKVAYHGPANKAILYFKRLGFRCPLFMNPGEFLVDLVSLDPNDPIQRVRDLARVEKIEQAFKKMCEERAKLAARRNGDEMDASSAHAGIRRPRKSPFWKRIGLLLKRAYKQNSRDRFVNGVRVLSCIGLAKVYGAVLGVGSEGASAASLPGKISLITFGVISMAQLSLIKTLDLFGRERETVARERMRGQYSAWEYVFSKVIAELPLDCGYSCLFAYTLYTDCQFHTPLMPFLGMHGLLSAVSASLGFAIGAASPSSDCALITGPTLMVVYMVLGVLNPSGVPSPSPSSQCTSPESKSRPRNDLSLDGTASRGDEKRETWSWRKLSIARERRAKEIQNYPSPLQTLKLFSPIKWTIEGMLCLEFKGLEFSRDFRSAPQMGAIALVNSGDQALKALGLSDQTTRNCVRAMFALLSSNLIFSVLALHANSQRRVSLCHALDSPTERVNASSSRRSSSK